MRSSLPRSAWECRRDAPRPCRQVDAHPRRCIPYRRSAARPRDAERRSSAPTRSPDPRSHALCGARSHAPRGSVVGTLRVPAAKSMRTHAGASRTGARPHGPATQSVAAPLPRGARILAPTLCAELAPTLRVGVSSGRSASLPPSRCAPAPVHPVPALGRTAPRRRASQLRSRAERGSAYGLAREEGDCKSSIPGHVAATRRRLDSFAHKRTSGMRP